ncbi:10003_t:CDS:2 [Paraglomus occultum]|uniref:10003_t:CDS:1 n=1 Tax=Paraglomus occultum TaxID=144539 RepID=A0A9N8ZH58_9GLOM|nr:10003_t:CDS:2 [Paraglomus occultum]
MTAPAIYALVTLNFASFIGATILAIGFSRARNNPTMVIVSVTIMFCSCVDFMGVIYGFDWTKAPEGVCYFQAMARQLAGFSLWTAGFCFTVQTYRLLVLYKRDDRLNRYYYGIILSFCTVGTLLVTIVSIKTKAVKAGNYRCDIVDPSWVRLLGSSGVSILLLPGSTYFSAVATYEIIIQLGRFKVQSNVSKNTAMLALQSTKKSTADIEADHPQTSSDEQSIDYRANVTEPVNDENKPDTIVPVGDVQDNNWMGMGKICNVTQTAAFRMILFSIMYFLLNLVFTIETIVDSFRDVPFDPRPNWTEFASAIIGIIIFLIFGTASDVRHWLGEKLTQSFRRH